MRPSLATTLVLASVLLAARPAPALPGGTAAPIRLAPHRAVYDLSLVASRGMRGIESARGRIALDLTGNACEGYNLNFRQVTVMDGSESASRTSDLRSTSQESGDGRQFRFRSDSSSGEGAKTAVDGNAERRQGGLAVRLRSPRREALALVDDALFPNAQMRDLIQAAREGRRLVSMRVFDGSDDGRKVYETLAVIADPLPVSAGEGLEEAARKDGLTRLRRWPVTLSYFAQGRGDLMPVYVLSFELYENGVSRALKLDYGDFVLRGDMVRLDLLPGGRPCGR